MDYFTTLRNTKGFNECKIVTRFKRSLWATEPQFKEVCGNCSGVQGRPAEDSVEDFIEETMYQVVFGLNLLATPIHFTLQMLKQKNRLGPEVFLITK